MSIHTERDRPATEAEIEATQEMREAGGEVLYGFDANTPFRTADEKYWATQVFRAMWARRPPLLAG